MSTVGSQPAPPRARPLARRAPLIERRQRARKRARERIAQHVRSALSPAQRAHDPLAHRPRSLGAVPWLASLVLHGVIALMGVLSSGQAHGVRPSVAQTVQVQVREPAPAVPAPVPPPEVTPPPEPVAPPKRVEPPRTAAPKPREPPPTPAAPPPRVVGLSLESTVEGGAGPAFGVGNTRLGQTADRATDKDEVVQGASGEPSARAPNAVASRIPTAGVQYALPRRKQERKPEYPRVLQSQGIEANVTVMLNLDASGKVIRVKLVTPSIYPEFNEAARRAALAEQFEPATRDGVAIPYTLSFTYEFRLEDS
jgi:periplasmic protein TonB